MKPIFRTLLTVLALVAGSSANAALFERSTANLQDEAHAAARDGKLLAVLLTLPDCPGCIEMEHTVHANPATAKALARQFRTVRLDIASPAPIADGDGKPTSGPELARRLKAIATPSYAFFDGHGRFLYRYTGTLNAAEFRKLGSYVARGEYEQRPFDGRPAADRHAGHDHH
ncbi:thioredoxin family protein [Dechloromonas sp. A34]|uniref:thioredoxin family protein n=1 Tax=Dechloromonas sp. A34 TaxID=447588 RepID=UPI00224985EB|nr:thioredoxin fold domain-containing protein [Dechloromonas sp. A34]